MIDQPAAVRGVTALVDLYKKGVLPKNSMNLKTEDVTTFMQQGRGAMTNNPFNRTTRRSLSAWLCLMPQAVRWISSRG